MAASFTIYQKIKINNDEIDTGFYPDHFSYAFSDSKVKKFTYSIELENETVSDSIIIPGKIDSVFLDGKLLSDSVNQIFSKVSKYSFSWSRSANAILYSKQYWLNNGCQNFEITSENAFTLILNPDTTQNQSTTYGSLNISGSAYPKITGHSKPNKESENLFGYYHVTGPVRYFSFSAP